MLPFPKKFSDFHLPKFMMSFFSHRLQILNFPLTCFFTYFMCISFPPYFDHDAFMHHTMHVLDASVSRLGTGSGTRRCGPRGGAWGAHEAETSFQIISALVRV